MKRIVLAFYLIIKGLSISLSCEKGFFWHTSSNTCQECHMSCRQSYCVSPEEKHCIGRCSTSLIDKILNVDNFECVQTCSGGVVLEFSDSIMFCKSPQLFIDQSIQEQTLQLGTQHYPLKALEQIKIFDRLDQLQVFLVSDGDHDFKSFEGWEKAAVIKLRALKQNTRISFNNELKSGRVPEMIFENLTIKSSEDSEIEWVNHMALIDSRIKISNSAIYSSLYTQNSSIVFNDNKELQLQIYNATIINSTILKKGNKFNTYIRLDKYVKFDGNLVSGLDSTHFKTSLDSNLIFKNNRVMNSSDLVLKLQSESMIFENNVFANLHTTTEPLVTVTSSSSLTLSTLSFTSITFSSHSLVHLILSDTTSPAPLLHAISFSKIQGLIEGGQISQALLKIAGEVEAAPLSISSISVTDLLSEQQSNFKMIIVEDCQEVNINDSQFQRVKASTMIHSLCGRLSIYNTEFNRLQQYGKESFFQSQTQISIQDCSFNNIFMQTSMVKFKNQGLLLITNSQFKKVISSDRGAIISINGKKTQATISNTSFTYNSALHGGLALIINNASVSFFNCSFISNFAIKSGLFLLIEANQLWIINSTILNNMAFANSILSADDVPNIQIVGSEIASNQVLSNEDIDENEFELLLKSQSIQLGEFTKEYYFSWKLIQKNLHESSQSFYQIYLSHSDLYVLSTVNQNQTSIAFVKYLGAIILIDSEIKNVLLQRNKGQQNGQSLFQAEEKGIIKILNTIIHNTAYIIDQTSNFSPYIFIINSGTSLTTGLLTYKDSNVNFILNIGGSFNGVSINIENISIPCNTFIGCPHFIHGINGQTNLQNLRLFNFRYHFPTNNFNNSMKNFNLPSIFYAETQVFKLHGEGKSIQMQNVQNCRIIYAIKQSQLYLSSIEIKDVEFEKEFLSFLSLENGASALYIKDSYFQGKSLKFQNIQSYSGPSVFQILVSKHQNRYSIVSELYRVMIEDSEFISNFGESGAINIVDQNTTIVRTKFYNNNSQKGNGGAISMKCSDESDLYWCQYNILSNDFRNNSALKGSGGALFYDFQRPIALLQNSFSDNIALQWNDLTRPFNKLIPLDKNIKVQSGSKISFSIALVDQYDFIIEQDSQSILRISDYRPEFIRLSEIQEVKLERGIAFFNNLTIIAKPGSKVIMEFQTQNFDHSSKSFLVKSLIMNFEVIYCKNGEIIQNMQCLPCPQGFYSFENNSTKCKKCIDNVFCQGKNSTLVLPGYWRETEHAEKIFSCLRFESCLGGINSSCAEGYKGKLCTQCSNNTKVYRKAGYTKCSFCLSKTLLLANYTLWLIIMELYCIYVLRQLIMKESRLKPSTLFIRILINYVQTLRILLQLNLYQADKLQTSYKLLSLQTTYIESILSFDCLLWHFGYDLESIDLYRIQILIYSSLPIFLTSLNYGILKLIQCILKKKQAGNNGQPHYQINVKEILYQVFFILSNLFYQTIVNLLMGMFNCMKLGQADENSFLIFDINVKCWSWDHHISKVLPLTIIFGGYIVIYPILIFFKLFKHRKEQNKIFRVYGIFLNGFKYEYYFWEVAVQFSLRILFIETVTFLPHTNIVVKSMILMIFIYSQVIIRKIHQPFIDPLINSIDLHSQYSILFMMFTFLIQKWVNASENVYLALQLIALVYNIFFFLIWLYNCVKCAIEWNLDKLRTFRLFNWILVLLKNQEMLTYIEQIRLRTTTDISIYLENQETRQGHQQNTNEEMINNQFSMPESSRKILYEGPTSNVKVQGQKIRRRTTRIYQGDFTLGI